MGVSTRTHQVLTLNFSKINEIFTDDRALNSKHFDKKNSFFDLIFTPKNAKHFFEIFAFLRKTHFWTSENLL